LLLGKPQSVSKISQLLSGHFARSKDRQNLRRGPTDPCLQRADIRVWQAFQFLFDESPALKGAR
jgi:hypothetical protein